MAYTGKRLIDWAARILHDKDGTRWPRADMLDYLNLAQVQVVTVQPQSNAVYRKMQLQPGALQKMQDDDLQLLTVVRNLGLDGETPGTVIGMTDRPSMDSHLASWTQSQNNVTSIESYVFDERVHDHFMVYPPPAAGSLPWVQYISAQRPADLTDEGQNLVLPDTFVIPTLRWVLYLCLSFQLDNPASASAALHQYQLFNNELGQQMSAFDLVNPSMMETYLGTRQGADQQGAKTNG